MKILVTRFLGTNCDRDVFQWLEQKGHQVSWAWFQDRFDTSNVDAVVIPGGFSYGDYLRSGALAAKTPVMDSVADFVKKGGPVLGICNGFQILCERHLLPGTLLRNESDRFVDNWAQLSVERKTSFFLKSSTESQRLKIPVAHGDGRFFVEDQELQTLKEKQQIWLRYEKNPNGSVADIAGITSVDGKVCGLMPHPERALFDWMGSADGGFFLWTYSKNLKPTVLVKKSTTKLQHWWGMICKG